MVFQGGRREMKTIATAKSASWLGALAIAAVAATPVLAHHSAAMFDMTKTEDIKGTVKEFHWTNPHSWLVLEARDSSGKTVLMNFEANGPGYLVRTGWKRETLKPGDSITVTANPLHDGSPGGNLVEVLFPDGHKLSARPVRPPAQGGAGAPGSGVPAPAGAKQ
jgi:hypothetical protein